MRDVRNAIRDARYGFRDASNEIRVPGYEMRALNPGSRIPHLETRIAQRSRHRTDPSMKPTRTQNLFAAAPGRLEALQGSRAGQYSIRVNDQFRLCFRWTAAGPEDVEIVDYH